MSYWQQVAAILRKDLALERRTRQSTSAMLVFSLTIAVTFNFALDSSIGGQVGIANTRNVALGLLWTIIWLAGTLGINRSFAADIEARAFDAILIAPIERSAIFFGKLLSLFLSMAVVELILAPLFSVLFNRPFYRPLLLLTLLLGTLGYVAAGVFVGSMAAQTRAGYLLTPILLLPLTLPIMLSAAAASVEFLNPQPDLSLVTLPLITTLIYVLLMCLAGLLFYNYVVEE